MLPSAVEIHLNACYRFMYVYVCIYYVCMYVCHPLLSYLKPRLLTEVRAITQKRA